MANEGNVTRKRRAVAWLKRLAGISSWLLLVSVAVLVVSGWGITQTDVIYNATHGLINRRTADIIHRASVLPLSFFFLLHVFINVGLGIKSKRAYVKQIFYWALLALGAAILALVYYMEYFRPGV